MKSCKHTWKTTTYYYNDYLIWIYKQVENTNDIIRWYACIQLLTGVCSAVTLVAWTVGAVFASETRGRCIFIFGFLGVRPRWSTVSAVILKRRRYEKLLRQTNHRQICSTRMHTFEKRSLIVDDLGSPRIFLIGWLNECYFFFDFMQDSITHKIADEQLEILF